MSSEKCIICDFDLKEDRHEKDYTYYFDCPHCGRYKISRDAYDDFPSLIKGKTFSNKKTLLSHFLQRMQTEKGWPVLDYGKIEKILKNEEFPTPYEQAENLILLVGQIQKDPGVEVKINYLQHGAKIGVKSEENLEFIFDSLFKQNLLSSEQYNVAYGYDFSTQLTFSGWEKYEELQRGITLSRKAFMAMPYNKENVAKIVDEHFRSAVEETGFILRRLDDDPKAGLIDNRLRIEIKTSRFLIADLTFDNNGSYWEAGYAEGLGKPVIYTCEKSHFEEAKTHFDTNHHQTVIWDLDKPEEAAKNLKATIRATLPDSKMV